MLKRVCEVAGDMYAALKFDLTHLADRREPTEPEWAARLRLPYQAPPEPVLRPTKTPYLSVVVDSKR